MAASMEGMTPSSSGTRNATRSDIVRVVPLSEYQAAAATLAEAFLHDEVGRYFIDTPDTVHWTEQQKWDLHVCILEYMTYAHILKGLVTTVGDDHGCVGLWMPPNTHMDDTLTLFRSGLWRLHYKLTPEGRHRFFTEFFPLLHHTKSSVLGPRDEDSYYLVYIGTRKEARGQGLARKLISHMTANADVEGRAMYLESSNVGNLGFYGRLGFEVRKQIALARGEKEVLLDVMVREPATSGDHGRNMGTRACDSEKADSVIEIPKLRLDATIQRGSKGLGEKPPSSSIRNAAAQASPDPKPLLA